MSTLHNLLPTSRCSTQPQRLQAVAHTARGRGEEHFLLKAWAWEEVAQDRVLRLSRKAVNPCRPVPRCCNFAHKVVCYLFFLFSILWHKVKPGDDLLQNRSASTKRPSYCYLLFVPAFWLLFYFSAVLEKMIWRWHESVKLPNNCHLCSIFPVLPQPQF